MKTKLFTLLLAVAASIGTMFASTKIGDLYYNLDATNQTAEVTYKSYTNNESWGITTANIPASVTYSDVAYSVTSIGVNAFWKCSGLTSVTIPNSVTSIGGSAFEDCSGLTSIIVESGNTVYDSRNNCNAIIETATNTLIEGCQNTIIPNSVTSIGVAAFYNCIGLTSVTIPNSVTSIEKYAFSGCTGLTSVTIPNSVTSIVDNAFWNCSGLTSVTAPAILFNDAFDIFTSQIKQLTINGGELTEEGFDRIHASYRKLETIDLAAIGNTEISDEAFKGCYNLKTLKLPAGLTQIGYMATAECVNLESIVIPASVEEIGDRAFEDCRSIKTITFGGSSSYPAPGRFNAPAASTSLLRRIGNWAFYNAHELQNLEIPEGVTEIGDGAFYGCTYLEDLVLPSSVQSIGDNTFALCSKLNKIVVNAVTPPSVQAKTFYDVKRQIPVYVPDECVDAYKNDAYWQEFDIQGASKMPQDIDQVPSDQVQCTKVVRNGQILILRGDKTYTITGAEMR